MEKAGVLQINCETMCSMKAGVITIGDVTVCCGDTFNISVTGNEVVIRTSADEKFEQCLRSYR